VFGLEGMSGVRMSGRQKVFQRLTRGCGSAHEVGMVGVPPARVSFRPDIKAGPSSPHSRRREKRLRPAYRSLSPSQTASGDALDERKGPEYTWLRSVANVAEETP
jgi:hypothetical protein